jgi:NAD(P)-dependent dehydrogenase (short-subunit alcohol dehydrogenase family)
MATNCDESFIGKVAFVTGAGSGIGVCVKHEIPVMFKQGGGAIVNTSSGAGVKGFKGQAAYAGATHGLIGLTNRQRSIMATQNIRSNAVCPGIIGH